MSKLFFVYGTLKEGHGNHDILDGSELVATGKTVESFYLWDVGFPYLSTKPIVDGHPKHRVVGEVYRVVDSSVEDDLDSLEGVNYGHYDKSPAIAVETDQGILDCHGYFVDGLNHQSGYGFEHMFVDEGERFYEWGASRG